MAPNHAKNQSLWKRIEDARLKWRRAHDDVIKIDHQAASIPTRDGSYAFSRAIHVERLAVNNYLRVLQEFQAAVGLHEVVENTGLTPREREVLALIASGRSSKRIAEQLGISFKTAVCHRYRIQSKLKAHNTADLTRAAMRMGLIEL